MFFRALMAMLALPGLLGFLLPPLVASVDSWRGPVFLPGMVFLLVGGLMMLGCAMDFYVAGKSSVAGWNPPRKLVVTGLYGHTRNPLYLGVVGLAVGWALVLASPLVALYGALLGVLLHLYVVRREEPWLQTRFPCAWPVYRRQVPRWWPRLKRARVELRTPAGPEYR